jgi:2-polyprenyl-3-methyl-5-hydroxy-6-metoxy-1,4-benzoquinol methylase
MRAALRWVKHTLKGLGGLHHLGLLKAQNEYLQREVARLAAEERRAAWRERRGTSLSAQTKASFSFQWEHMPKGIAMPSDPAFMAGLEDHVCALTRLPREWFAGKRVVDVGCGIGRYSYGLLTLGARVTSCDQSEAALRRTAELCRRFQDQHSLEQIDLLDWNHTADFDLAFSFGVVHHTGNTYLAIENVCNKVRPGGRVFLMIYGVPETKLQFDEVNEYEQVAEQVRDMTFEQRKAALLDRFGADAAHGWFDAVSPRINDRLTFEEIHELLSELSFINIARTVEARNHSVIADRL